MTPEQHTQPTLRQSGTPIRRVGLTGNLTVSFPFRQTRMCDLSYAHFEEFQPERQTVRTMQTWREHSRASPHVLDTEKSHRNTYLDDLPTGE